jgi:hypothetical protein
MLNPTSLLANALGSCLGETYQSVFGERESHYAAYLHTTARLVIECIANSDALYHNTEHTALVTLVGQDILRGKRLTEPVEPSDWLHFTVALLMHDIGYVRGICPGDQTDRFVADESGATKPWPRGASDALLTPYHVDRSKLFVRERCRKVAFLDIPRIIRAIELTRFPVPEDGDHAETGTEAGLVRAADLIGQLGDPHYLRKLNALYHEFAETGAATCLGLTSPADLVDAYPTFFWGKVEPYLGDALRYLERTTEGKQWIANLYSHVFAVEHHRRRLGPHPTSD